MSQSSEFCPHNPLCCFFTSVYCCCLFRYRLSPETFGIKCLCSYGRAGVGPTSTGTNMARLPPSLVLLIPALSVHNLLCFISPEKSPRDTRLTTHLRLAQGDFSPLTCLKGKPFKRNAPCIRQCCSVHHWFLHPRGLFMPSIHILAIRM
jgi:hypothetical protein